ncbi:MAG: DUF3791 domain-containing protein [Solobacterium sp.]|nr:DUF3791 domain-containing protein [Solobacterium sp.]
MNANATLLQKKYARIIERYANKCDVSIAVALRHFYHSDLYQLISTGVSDMHCMSDDYLADELKEEWSKSRFYDVGITEVKEDSLVVLFSAGESITLHVSSEVILNSEEKCIGGEQRADRLIQINPTSVSKLNFKYQIGEHPKYLQFIVQDETHQKQHSIILCVDDGHVFAKRMKYKDISEPYDHTEWE